jgi:peptidoglycan/xylan/chitin deacetylase (PgdA/CDA1 family)
MSLARTVLGFMTRTGAVSALERTMGAGGIVGYHAVTPAPLLPAIHISLPAFREQVEFLAQSYSVIPLEEFVKRRTAGRSLRGCAAITFDDAYTGVRDLALPILEQHALPATVFVASDYSATGTRYWWDRLGWIALRASPAVTREVMLAVTGDPAADQHRILHSVISRSEGRLALDLRAVVEAAEQELDQVPLRPLDEAGLAELGRSALIDFGCHTMSHPALPRLSVEDQLREIRGCNEWMLPRLPRVRPFVAYPFGLYSPGTLEAMRSAGMQAGFSLAGRAATSRFSPLSCPRIGLAEGNSLLSLRAQLTWAAIPAIALRNREWHPRMPSLRHSGAAGGAEQDQV